MSVSASLLAQAAATLEEATPHSTRAACWIARAALESAVDDLLNSRQRPAPDASMRSKLTVLHGSAGDEDDVPARAEYAWSSLSQACHHHAFELSPTGSEVRHLLDLVAGLIPTPAEAATSPWARSDVGSAR